MGGGGNFDGLGQPGIRKDCGSAGGTPGGMGPKGPKGRRWPVQSGTKEASPPSQCATSEARSRSPS